MAALVVEIDRSEEDLVCGLLWSLDTLGVLIGDRPEPTDTRLRVTAYFPDAGSARPAAEQLDRLGLRSELHGVDPYEYSDRWRLHARTHTAGSGIVIHPPWETPDADPSRQLVLEIEPGRAFGSGSHPTTRLCLRLLERHLPSLVGDPRVLDVGTGTGILAVAAARLGAGSVVVTETDSELRATWELNAEQNRVADRIGPGDTDLSTHAGRYDLVMANLLLPTLRELSDDLVRLTTDQGRLIVSGVLLNQVDELLDLLGELVPVQILREDGWAALCLAPGHG